MYGRPPGVVGVAGGAGVLAATGFPTLAMTMLGVALVLAGFIMLRAAGVRHALADGGSASLWDIVDSPLGGPH